MVRVPLRAAPLLVATVNETLPLPMPLGADVRAIKLELLAADQPHPVVVTTLTLSCPPAEPTDWLVPEEVSNGNSRPGVTVRPNPRVYWTPPTEALKLITTRCAGYYQITGRHSVAVGECNIGWTRARSRRSKSRVSGINDLQTPTH